jgi:hypothetical protein
MSITNSTQADRAFQAKPITDSMASRSGIPRKPNTA